MSTKDRVSDNSVIVQGDAPHPANVLVPVGGRPQQLAPYNPIGRAGQVWANWELTSREAQARLMKGRGNPDLRTEDVLGQVFYLSHTMIHQIEMVDDSTGEVKQVARTVLFDPAGRTCAFVSAGIIDSLGFLSSMFGVGPWDPPLPIVIRQIGTRKGRRTYEIRLHVDTVEAVDPAPARRGKKGE